MTMFLVTGALYTYGYKPSSTTVEHRLTLEYPLEKDYDLLNNLLISELAKLNVEHPLGKAKLKRDKKRRSFIMEWEDNNMSVSLRHSSVNKKRAVFKIKHYSWYNRLMSLHKGKGEDIFDIFTIASSVLMLLILISGVILGLQVPGLRKFTLYSLGVGVSLFVGMVAYVQFVLY